MPPKSVQLLTKFMISLIPYFSAAFTTASNRCKPLAPVLIVAEDPEKDWKYTVPDPGTDLTSLKPQIRRILRLEVWRCDIMVSTSLLLVRKGIQ